MPQIINTNIASLNAQRNLNKSQSANQTSLERLSSGLRINSAKDDAAGLAISTRFNSQIRGLNVAVRNAGDGISLAQTAEGALGSMNDNLQRVRELAVQSANATNSDVDRDALQAEVAQLLSEVSRTAEETDFNGRKLLDGSFSATFQIGANAGQTLDVSIAELTADKLGSASTAGVTAIGNENALSNGDLIINGVSISASNASDDTSSTDNAGASAISKVAAINRQSDETGVSASVNTNVVSGAEMTGAATTGTLELNGVDIDLTTTSSSSGTRASVAEAINAVSDQTGVKAINSDSDTGGIQLIAEDGRNISMSVTTGGSLTAASTGLALDAVDPINNLATYEGGYTLVADAAVGEVVIDGGNGTGKGDLSNAGLVAGTYDRGVASSVSEVQKETITQSTVAGGSLANDVTSFNDNAQVLTGGSLENTIVAASAVSAGILTNYQNVSVSVGGATATAITVASGATLQGVISAIDSVAGVDAFERIAFNITDFNSTTGGNTLYLANATIALPDDDAAGSFNSAAARLTYLTEAINTASYSAGVTVSAELNAAKTSISITIDNDNTAGAMRIGLSTGATVAEDLGGAAIVAGLGTLASATSMVGSIAYVASAGAVTVSISEATAGVAASGEIYVGKTYSGEDTGSTALSSSGDNQVNISIDGIAQTAVAVGVNSTVSDLAEAINAVDDVNAWEEITLSFDATNLEVGDTIYLGTGADVTTGAGSTAIAATDADGSGGAISLADLADNINESDFSAKSLEVSAEISSDGLTLNVSVKNFSGAQVGMVTDAEGRSMTIAGGNADDKLIGSVQKQLSGELAYASESGAKLDVTIADASVGGEFYAGNSSTSEYAGVNGLDDGDILINGVSIGSANVGADTASAENASDGTRILTSSKELSAIAVAASINDVSEETGVSATINATQVVGGDGSNLDTSNFSVGDSSEIYINGYVAGTVTLQDNGSGDIDTDRAKSDALAVINSISGKSGVVATDNGVSLTMVAEDGRNVSIALDDQSGNADSIGALFGMDSAIEGIGEATFGKEPAASNNGISAESAAYQTTYGTVTLEAAGEFTVASGADGADELNALGLSEGSYGGAVDGQFLSEVDVSTFEGATAALTAIDNAIGAIASQRADLGAIQNRIESTVSNLAITSENLSAANSRIQDADFAAETAELSRTQVLQQAGISILSQANQGPQQVLSLLG